MASLTIRNYFPSRRARVVITRMPRQAPMGRHRHEFVELVVVISGEAVHVMGRARQQLRGGDVLVIPRSVSHGYEATRGLNLVNILIRHDWMPRLARDLQHLAGYHRLFPRGRRGGPAAPPEKVRLTARDLGAVQGWIASLEEEAARNDPAGWLLAEAYLILILGLLCRTQKDAKSAPVPTPSARIGRALSWLEQNLHHAPTVAAMAREAGMSERTFHRAFRQRTGLSPHRYRLRSQVHLACSLLAGDRELRVGEVAVACGFRDGNELARVLRRERGKAPSELRGTGRGKAAEETVEGRG